MTRIHVSLTSGAVAGLAAALFSFAAEAATHLRYEVWSGGARVLDIALRVETASGDSYRLAFDALLVGPPAWFTDYRLLSAVEGRQRDGALLPLLFHQRVEGGDEPRWLRLAFDAQGLPTAAGEPEPVDETERLPVPAAQRLGAQDPLSAVLTLLLRTAAGGACDDSVPVFDGRRRFDLGLTDLGQGEVRPGFGLYAGAAQRCSVVIEPIAGYRLDGEDRERLPESMTVFLARPGEGLPLVPVRLEAEAGYGALMMHLVEAATVP